LATEGEHLSQFEHNVRVADRLAAMRLYDRAVTALFYAALHLAQAYLVRMGEAAETHVQRERRVLLTPDLRPILHFYRTLRDYSEEARYACRRFNQEEFEVLRDRSFAAVVPHLRALLGVP